MQRTPRVAEPRSPGDLMSDELTTLSYP
jgi:hypothetical protein